MIGDYKNKKSEISSLIRSTFGFTFLSPQEVSLCFDEEWMFIIPDDISVIQYSDWTLLDTYILENAKFPPIKFFILYYIYFSMYLFSIFVVI